MPAEPAGSQPPRELDASLYNLDAEEIGFFKQQTGISDDEELKEHIIAVQREAYAVHPYPCIHRFAFTQLKISRLPAYQQVLELGRTRAHPIFLDIGCCFGNDLRKAIADGFPAEGCIGSDIRPEFWELGHRLFRSSSTSFPVPFVAGDAFDSAMLTPDAPFANKHELTGSTAINVASLAGRRTLNPLHGRVSVIHASSFFHLFSEEQQSYLARALAPLLSPEPGSMLLGSHGGLPKKGFRPGSRGRQAFCHSTETWSELWEGVFGKGNVKVEAELVSRDRPDLKGTEREGMWYVLMWSVTRL